MGANFDKIRRYLDREREHTLDPQVQNDLRIWLEDAHDVDSDVGDDDDVGDDLRHIITDEIYRFASTDGHIRNIDVILGGLTLARSYIMHENSSSQGYIAFRQGVGELHDALGQQRILSRRDYENLFVAFREALLLLQKERTQSHIPFDDEGFKEKAVEEDAQAIFRLLYDTPGIAVEKIMAVRPTYVPETEFRPFAEREVKTAKKKGSIDAHLRAIRGIVEPTDDPQTDDPQMTDVQIRDNARKRITQTLVDRVPLTEKVREEASKNLEIEGQVYDDKESLLIAAQNCVVAMAKEAGFPIELRNLS